MKQRCEFCNIELDENDFALHVKGKRHLKNVEAENYKKEFIEKSIYVTRMPVGLTVDNVCNFFGQFGAIERCKLEPHFAIIEFKQKNPVNFLLSRPIWMGQHKLDIKQRRWNKSVPTKQPDADKTVGEIVFADLKTRLQSQTSFDDELSTFLEVVQLNLTEVENNWRFIHAHLLETWKPAFPNCTITRFGSSTTGLCFKGSDIDIYLCIGEEIHDEDNGKHRWTPRTVFKEVKSHLYRKKNIFERIVPIPNAKTPIIKFCHSPTGTNCDISLKNGLGVINSDLIKKLLSLDVRLKPLMLVIKYWAKIHDLSGCGKFTNYAIVMMMIFYLQQPEVKMLPAIVELQKTCEPMYNWNWQVNFDRGAVFPTSTVSWTLLQLLEGFFQFYSIFSYEKMIISPSLGVPHSREDFAKLCAEKGGDADYLSLDRPICLQDPIELDNNVTSGVNAKILDTFKKFCAVGSKVCEVALSNSDEPFLLNLFTTVPEKTVEPKLSKKSDKRPFPGITIRAKNLKVGLPDNFEKRNDIVDKNKFAEDNWYSLVQSLVEITLKRVFKIEVQRVTIDREAKQQKVAEPSDVHSKDNDKIILDCIGNHCVVTDRKAKGFSIDPSLSAIDKEAMITDELIEWHKTHGVKPTKLEFSCTIVREKNPVRLVISLDDRNSEKKRFRAMASFMSTKIPKIVDKELIHMLQYNKKHQVSSIKH